jgi:hypothetical protein
MDPYTMTEEAYKRGLEMGKPKWVSVDTALPEPGRYLVIRSNELLIHSYVTIAEFTNDGKSVDGLVFVNNPGGVWYDYDSEYGYYHVPGVTHWMPLPDVV